MCVHVQMINNKAITFDVREATGKPAGVGRIISSMIKAMQTIDPQREFVLVGDAPVGPSGINGKYISIKSSGMLWHVNCARIIKENPQWGTYISVRSPLVPIMVPERSVYFVNDLISFKYPQYFTLKTRIVESLFVKLALKKVKNIVAISQSTARDIEELCPGAKSRTTVVPLAADPIFKIILPDINILIKYGMKKPYILSVGTIEPRKNHVTLLKAYQDLPNTLRDKYDLVIVGKRGWKCGGIMKAINKGIKSGSVKYLEFISDNDLVHIYNGASLFVYPSLYEGFGLPVVEAMSCGVPTIISNNSSLPEVGGSAARYFDPYKPNQIADLMVNVLTDKTISDQMSLDSIEYSRRFNWEKTAREIFNIIDGNYHNIKKKMGLDK